MTFSMFVFLLFGHLTKKMGEEISFRVCLLCSWASHIYLLLISILSPPSSARRMLGISKSLVCVHTFALWEKKKKKKAGKCGRVAKREGNIYSRDAPSRYDSYNNRELMPFHPSTASFFFLSLFCCCCCWCCCSFLAFLGPSSPSIQNSWGS